MSSAGAATDPHPEPPPLTGQLIAQLGQGTERPVIVLLRDQHPEAPPTRGNGGHRAAVTQGDQRNLVEQARQTGATHIHQFTVVNGFSATMTDAERAHLAADPRVRAIVPDLPLRRSAPAEAVTRGGRAGGATAPTDAACPADPAKPLLEPEALQATNTAFADPAIPQAQRLADGSGVRVAYLADGVDTDNPDFIRADGTHVFVDSKDFTGEGLNVPNDDREAFGDASSVAAQGRQTYDLSTFVHPANPLPAGCTIQIRGVAPGASLVGLKVIASTGFGSTSAAVQAIDYAVNVDHVDVINESLGAYPYPDRGTDPLSLANDEAVAAGATITSSSGDGGFGNTIDSPSSDPDVISVGASSTYRIMAQTWDSLPGFTGRFLGDNVSAISSSGIDQRGRVYDLVAPGDLGWALCSADTATHHGCTDFAGKPSPIQVFGGTSQAAPLVAGAAALVIQAYGITHSNTRPSPALIKQILTSTATDLRDPAQRQGAGLLNAYAAVVAAGAHQDANGHPAVDGDSLLFGATQFDAVGAPGSTRTFDLTVTNEGEPTQVISAHGRALTATTSDLRGSIALDTTSPPTMHTRGGADAVHVTRRFAVPAGADHLDASIAWTSPNGPPVTLVLLDPAGAFAGYSLPQAGTGPDFGHVDVHTPAAGTWTALIYSPHTTAGFNGPVSFEFTTTRYADFGSVSGQLRLATNQSGTLHVTATLPAQPGDLAAAIEVDSSTGRHFAIPLVLRGLVANDGHGTFAGVLAGGNGRGGAPAQTNTYRFDVPGGRRDVDVSVSLQGSVNQSVVGYLVDPGGQIVGQATNVTGVDAKGMATGFTQSLQVYKRDPLPGRWAFVAVFANPVNGAATQEPFTGELRFDIVDVAADNVPHDAGAVLPAGRPISIPVRVHNTGAAPGSFYVDARTAATTDLQLTPNGPAADVPLAPSASVGFVVPTNTTTVTGIAAGTIPVSLDLGVNTGAPEHLALPGPANIATATDQGFPVSQGLWLVEADPVGPFTDANSAGKANLAAVAHTQGFDPAVTSSTGDHWLSAGRAQPGAFTPVAVDPTQTGTITVTITPAAPKGTVVSGYLYVDNDTPFNQAGDELAAIPYAYTVG